MNPITSVPNPPRRDRLLQEKIHDPYLAGGKIREPAVCPTCRAVFRRGRWQWANGWPMGSHEELCPACRRTKEQYPAGIMTLSGAFALAHESEMLHLARHQEAQEKANHPLHRIMAVEATNGAIVIKTTDLHLPHRLGKAMQQAYKGKLEIHYDRAGCLARVNWNRD